MDIKEKRKIITDECVKHGECDSCILFEKMPEKVSDYELCYEFNSVEDIDLFYKALTECDNVNHPKHYTSGKHECIDVMVEMFGVQAVIDFCKCNIFKYRFRAAEKNGEEDIKKAEWYESKLIELNRKVAGKNEE